MNTFTRKAHPHSEVAPELDGRTWLTVREVGRLFGCSQKAAYKRLVRSSLPDGTLRRWGSTLLVNLPKLNEWIASGRAAQR